MNGSITITKETTINLLKKHIEEGYSCGSCEVIPEVTAGYDDYRGPTQARVDFTFKCLKDLGLGIGLTPIEVKMSEKEAKDLLKKALETASIETQDVEFMVSSQWSGYGSGETQNTVFKGTNIKLKSAIVSNILTANPVKKLGVRKGEDYGN